MRQRLVDTLVRRFPWDASDPDVEPLIAHEWLVTNGLGGYASSTVAGINTRRYHGLLVAALPNPIGRMVMLSAVGEHVVLPDGSVAQLGGEELNMRALEVPAAGHLTEFRLEVGLPVWRFTIGDVELERRLLMPHGQNTVHITYRLLSGGPVRLELRPMVQFRGYEAPVSTPIREHYPLTIEHDHYLLWEGSGVLPPLRMLVRGEGHTFVVDGRRTDGVVYRVETRRGFPEQGVLWNPGRFSATLAVDQPVAFVASTESYEVMTAVEPHDALAWGAELERRRRLLTAAPPGAQSGRPAELVLAADQFIITPAGRNADAARARAVGDEVRTVIAGYHWFTDWGRDTMISLEGLTLATGRHREAGFILRTFAHYVRDGLIPNMFPDGSNEGLYHTADATLWFFHAVDRYLATTGDEETLTLILPALRGIVEHHLRGTRFGIGVDPNDGLLRQGADGYQLTWMDAKVEGWVVTPRRGKAVEINALWYNALCLLEGWVRDRVGSAQADALAGHAARARHSFNKRFWYAEGGYLYDVVDGPEGDSTECRPNQLFAISLKHPVLDESRWEPVLTTAEQRLLTPVGLRSLAPGSPNYRPTYDGDLRSRDAAYHQGTVWGWLIGPWIDAWLRVHPEDRPGARRFLDGVIAALDTFGIGSIAEIFDAEAPYTPRGCIAQAWSVAEALRCLLKTM
jgi:predicted glycogen debranching enzyme